MKTIVLKRDDTFAKASRKAMEVQIDTDARTAKILPDNIQFSWNKVGADFPPYEQVIPASGVTPKDGFRGMAIATEYLIFAGKVFATLAKSTNDGRSTGVYVEMPQDELSPIVMSSAAIPNLVIVVMPNRTEIGPDRRSSATTKKAA